MFNIARFASQFPVPADLEMAPSAQMPCTDRWILAEFAGLCGEVEAAYRAFDIFSASRAMKCFGTGFLSSHWMELAKGRLHAGDASSRWALHRILRDWLTLFSPVCPLFAHYLSDSLYQRSAVDIRAFPQAPLAEATAEVVRLRALSVPLCDFNSHVWRAKTDAGQSFNAEIAGIAIPEGLVEFSVDLIAMHKLT